MTALSIGLAYSTATGEVVDSVVESFKGVVGAIVDVWYPGVVAKSAVVAIVGEKDVETLA